MNNLSAFLADSIKKAKSSTKEQVDEVSLRMEKKHFQKKNWD